MSRAAILLRAREIAQRVNTDQSLSRDARWDLSMELSKLQQRLGSRGVDRAYADAESEDDAGQAE